MLCPLALCLALAPIAAIAAPCVTAENLAGGITFAREDHRTGLVQARDGGVFIDYSTNADTWQDERQTLLGIYETSTQLFRSAEPSMGGGTDETRWAFAKAPPVPVAGQTFATRIREVDVQHNSSEAGQITSRQRIDGTYDFLDEVTVKIGGCPYVVIPVEARFDAKPQPFTRRWLYFKDLGFGLETKQGEDRFGITRLQPK